MTEEDRNAAKLAALEVLSSANREMACADSKIREMSACLYTIVEQPGSMNLSQN